MILASFVICTNGPRTAIRLNCKDDVSLDIEVLAHTKCTLGIHRQLMKMRVAVKIQCTISSIAIRGASTLYARDQ